MLKFTIGGWCPKKMPTTTKFDANRKMKLTISRAGKMQGSVDLTHLAMFA